MYNVTMYKLMAHVTKAKKRSIKKKNNSALIVYIKYNIRHELY